jgi:lysine 2,3-aminomutase
VNHALVSHEQLVEPDWRRLPGFARVSRADWGSARWQRRHSVRTVAQLADVFGDRLSPALAADIRADQLQTATMPMLVTPQLLSTMDERDLEADPVRRYMLPARSEREPRWPSHPRARRDSLAESEMWAVEGLVHRYPSKVLVELLSTCPQYCGHCTRMDLVGTDTPQVVKYEFKAPSRRRYESMLGYIRATPAVRDVVVSGGDLANVPIRALETFVSSLLDIPHVRHVRLATKSLVTLPQHFLQADVLGSMERLARTARAREVDLALHTHANHSRQITPLVARAARSFLDAGFRAVRNQGVLLRGVNADPAALLELCLALERAAITPYYFYLCDLIPNAEHWRTPLWEARDLQHSLMGRLPGFATPRLVCDVPYLGKMWVDQADEYDRERGISYWRKQWLTPLEEHDPDAPSRRYEYYDPVHTLPEAGRRWWEEQAAAAGDLARTA